MSSPERPQEDRTSHHIIHGDAARMAFIPESSIHLALTRPPSWLRLQRYGPNGRPRPPADDYGEFLTDLETILTQVYRILAPGGRLVCLARDIWLSRKQYGRHRVIPFAADVSVVCRRIGFDHLNPIVWNRGDRLQPAKGAGPLFLGNPYEPNGIIKQQLDCILLERKPGGYRQPTAGQRSLSRINKSDYLKWFRPFWDLSGEAPSGPSDPFPAEIARRLVRMFSFRGDTVIDPFCGSGTILLAALRDHRSSVGIDIRSDRCRLAFNRLQEASEPLFSQTRLSYAEIEDVAAAAPPEPEAPPPGSGEEK